MEERGTHILLIVIRSVQSKFEYELRNDDSS
jgi:hypothetical protein